MCWRIVVLSSIYPRPVIDIVIDLCYMEKVAIVFAGSIAARAQL